MIEPGSATAMLWRDELTQASRVVDGIRGSLGQLERVARVLVDVLRDGGCIFTCGNGGSALAAQHFTAELLAHYRRDRPAVRSVALTADAGLVTAIGNDYSFDQIFSRQIMGLVTPRDAVLGFSTSGRSANIVRAIQAAREIGAVTVGFGGGDGGEVAGLVDHALVIPVAETARVQEGHLILTHLICEWIDATCTGAPDQARP